jgi:hypothetical protein
VFRLDEEFLEDADGLVLVLFDWPHSARHYGVPQSSHLGSLFFINNGDKVFRIFRHVSALGYPNDLKLFMTIESVEDCHRFQSDLDRLQEWCSRRKFGLNAAKSKSIY